MCRILKISEELEITFGDLCPFLKKRYIMASFLLENFSKCWSVSEGTGIKANKNKQTKPKKANQRKAHTVEKYLFFLSSERWVGTYFLGNLFFFSVPDAF